MTRFTIKIAGCVAQVTAIYDGTREFCQAYLWDGAPDLSIEITDRDIAFEREKSIREDALEGKSPRTFSDAYLETIAVQRKIAEALFAYDTLLFHGSVIAVDGLGYLFTAKSGTGKSTHTRLWRQMLGQRAVMVNDDKPFLRIDRDGAVVFGSPWNGKHGLGSNISVPLKAICILERGKENRIYPIAASEAVFMLLQQSNRPMDKRKLPQYMELLDRLAENVKFYRLACNMDPQAAEIAFAAMAGGDKGENYHED